jgi:hypothetical protein
VKCNMHVMRRGVSRVVCAGIMAILLVGCGDGALSKSSYVEQNNAIQQDATKSIQNLGELDPAKPEEAAARIGSVQRDLDAAITKLRALKPPSEWADEHTDMVAALVVTSGALKSMASGVTRGDAKAVQAANDKMVEADRTFNGAIKSMNNSR